MQAGHQWCHQGEVVVDGVLSIAAGVQHFLVGFEVEPGGFIVSFGEGR